MSFPNGSIWPFFTFFLLASSFPCPPVSSIDWIECILKGNQWCSVDSKYGWCHSNRTNFSHRKITRAICLNQSNFGQVVGHQCQRADPAITIQSGRELIYSEHKILSIRFD
jgi:hypothetical protein